MTHPEDCAAEIERLYSANDRLRYHLRVAKAKRRKMKKIMNDMGRILASAMERLEIKKAAH